MGDWVYQMILHEMRTLEKSELIYDMISEFPCRIDVIRCLVKIGYVKELPDEEEKRSKRIQITKAGLENHLK